MVNNNLYGWNDVKITALKDGSYKLTVSGNPSVINRRKYARMPLSNRCRVYPAAFDGKVFAGKMVNISANGFAFATRDIEIEKMKGTDVRLEIEGIPELKNEKFEGTIIRITSNEGWYYLGCRMHADNMVVRKYVQENHKE